MDPKRYRHSLHSTVLCIYSVNYILATWNFLNEKPLWKFPAESSDVCELGTDTLLRGAREEAGLIIPVVRDKKGIVQKLGNENVRITYVSPQWKGLHLQYFYGIRILDAHLLSLSDKLLWADEDELLWTRAFAFMEPRKMPNFHAGHLKRFEEMLDYANRRTA